ncbi:DUF3800 domain-containing protein [Corallococcus sp. AS-1-12]|uniref:DUF3800 domain-containing protein n=1 Tax=Corallococcus sp. AS-1-12 TaxID=2874598 RepID=UPI001CC13276|nr:DUF3800 domain-containing protein [Corallococcus sp. AS-1-12]MBZ4336664.1 DUF3800 domain-containing protein [Corallococcus sp. AS-1-12]
MLIFIDESGTFKAPAKPNSVSCVTALIVPESFARTLFRKFRKAIAPWRTNSREIKGSKLDEEKISNILKILRRFDVLVVSVCMDMGLHSEEMIQSHKHEQATKFLNAARAGPPSDARTELENLAARIRALPNQLYAQSVAMSELAGDVITASTLYYSQRIPATLGSFRWRIDAKNSFVTEYEKLWLEIVLPYLQTRFLRKPMLQLVEADYSAFAKYELTLPEPPDHLKPHIDEKRRSEPFYYTDTRKILTEDTLFRNSERYSGLQLVDIVASTIRRACNGTLQKAGWDDVGKLMVQKQKANSLRFLTFNTPVNPPGLEVPYDEFIKKCNYDCKKMLTKTMRVGTK